MGVTMERTTVWIDLTDMLDWKGHFTGIQQVTYNYAKRFEGDGARFFAYDKQDDRFIELDLEIVKPHESIVDDASLLEEPREEVRLRTKLRRVAAAPYGVLPLRYRQFLQPATDVSNHYLRLALSKIIPIKEDIVPISAYAHMPGVTFNHNDTVVLIGAGWNNHSVMDRLAAVKEEIDIRIVQHINDILPVYQPHLFADELPKAFAPYITKVITNADVVTVISEATKRDFLAFCQQNSLSAPVVRVVRLGDDVSSTKVSRPQDFAEGAFILSVGTFEIRKNYQLLYQAVKLSELEGRPIPRLVIVGRKGWLTADLRHVIKNDPYVKDHIVWMENVSDEELAWLYENCLFTVFASLAEGWGLPVVESLQRGKMCIASGVSSMLEIGEGLVDYFLPYDARECLEKIHFYLAENRYEAANENIAKEYKSYSWHESYEAYKSAVLD